MPEDTPRRPFVVAHVAVTLDGATTGFEPNVGRFYELAATWNEDVTLTGADTVIPQEAALAAAARPGPAESGPLLAVVDGRARVREWEALRDVGHWSGVLALRSETTPAGSCPVPELVEGTDRVDLAAVLTALGRRDGVEVVRVDSGGTLLAALLDAELLDEVSLLLHPRVGGGQPDRRWHGSAENARGFDLVENRTFDGGLVWLRYRPARPTCE